MQAPDFSLKDQDQKIVSLSQFRGRWVVLYFYPKDDTPGCTLEACSFTAMLADFTGLNAVILGVSPDSPDDHLKFQAKHSLGMTLLSDPEKKVFKAYGAFGKKLVHGKDVEGVIRSTFLIDPEGQIAEKWVNVTVKGHAEEVRDRLKKIHLQK